MNGEKDKADVYTKYIAILLALIFIIAGAVYIYVNLPKNEEKNEEPTPEENILLTTVFGSDSFNYSLEDLMNLENTIGYGRYKSKKGISDLKSYTGVSVQELLDTIDSLPDNYTLVAFAKDDYNNTYSMYNISGHVEVYNESGNGTGIGNLTMIIAYEEDGVILNDSLGGPLRIVFVDEEGSITDSGLWAKYLIRIEII